jgi:peptide/nickel transport system permease protein
MSTVTTLLEPRPVAAARKGALLRSPARLGLAALLVLLALVLAFPGLFATHAPEATDVAAALRPPDGRHWLGTDQLGRDVYSRLVHGTRLSMLIAFGATLIGVGGGALLGLVAGCGGRRVEPAATVWCTSVSVPASAAASSIAVSRCRARRTGPARSAT